MSTVKHPITIKPTTKTAAVATVPSSQRGTGADNVPVTKFSAGVLLTPIRTFSMNFGGKLYSFQNGAPRVVATPLRSAIIALSNASTDKYVKETT
jgi:hypothetical protein